MSDALDTQVSIDTVRVERVSEGEVSVNLGIKLALKNLGGKSLILLRNANYPNFHNGVNIAESPEDFKRRKYLASIFLGEAIDRSESWLQLVRLLDTPQPNKEVFIVLGPNEFEEFKADIAFTLPSKKGGPNTLPGDEDWEKIHSLRHVLLQVLGSSWSDNIDRAKKGLSQKLRKRWKKYGYLWTDSIISTPTLLDLSRVVVKDEITGNKITE